MLQNNPTILITGEIDDSLVTPIISKGFTVDVIPFIETKSLQTAEVQQTVEAVSMLDATVLFTSSNAVEAVHHFIQAKKLNWKIYCVGNATASLIKKLFAGITVIAVADNGVKLAQAIIADKGAIDEVYFFCGDKRRNELPLLLTQNNIAVNETEVYTTTILQHKLSKHYDGILFFSPSAVEGFFKNNNVDDATALFAIGSTTADEIKKYSTNKIVVTDKPGKGALIERVMQFL